MSSLVSIGQWESLTARRLPTPRCGTPGHTGATGGCTAWRQGTCRPSGRLAIATAGLGSASLWSRGWDANAGAPPVQPTTAHALARAGGRAGRRGAQWSPAAATGWSMWQTSDAALLWSRGPCARALICLVWSGRSSCQLAFYGLWFCN